MTPTQEENYSTVLCYLLCSFDNKVAARIKRALTWHNILMRPLKQKVRQKGTEFGMKICFIEKNLTYHSLLVQLHPFRSEYRHGFLA
jgi:hypothetical protein